MTIPPVTVIVPCFNEEVVLPSLLQRLDHMHENGAQDWHVVFVDDGSTDETFAGLLTAVRDRPWLEVLRHERHLGVGAAMKTGFAYATSPIVCTMDCDCGYPPERLPQLTELVEGGADIGTASARRPNTLLPRRSRLRVLLSRTVSRTYESLIGQDVQSYTCMFRAYRRTTLESTGFRTNGFASTAEIMLRALIGGADVRSVPMRVERHRDGESKLKVGATVFARVALLTLAILFAMATNVRRPYRLSGDQERVE